MHYSYPFQLSTLLILCTVTLQQVYSILWSFFSETYCLWPTLPRDPSNTEAHHYARFEWPSVKSIIRRLTRLSTDILVHNSHLSRPLMYVALFTSTLLALALPPSPGFSYLLTCVDRFAQWPEALSLTYITAEDVAQAFLSGWIAHFGVPSTIVIDRGRQSKSKLWQALICLCWGQEELPHPV